MKIKNETHWRTADLKRFITRCLKFEEVPPVKVRRLQILFVYNKAGRRHDYVSGRATIGGTWVKIMVGKHSVDKTDLAGVLVHEFGHSMGLRHSDMRGKARYNRTGNWRTLYAWAGDLPLEVKPTRAKPKGEVLQLLRYKRALASIARWETKLRRAGNALKKLRQTRTRYERVFAARGTPIDREDK